MSRPQNSSEKFKPDEKEHGPGSMAGAHGKIRVDKNTLKIFGRLMKYYRGRNLFFFTCAMVFTLANALISVKASLFVGSVIDDFIAPLLLTSNPDFSALLSAIKSMALLYCVGIICTLLTTLFLNEASQGILKDLRDTVFGHLQTLPVKYYDVNQYGDIMSRFTNDIDNIRQMLSQSIPQVFSTVATLVSVLAAMIKLSWKLTLIVACFVVVMYMITITVGGSSAKFFVLRQKTLGNVNAYVEEMLNGQKVVKVFCHEDAAKNEFDKRNTDLFEKTAKANGFANIMMPLMVQLGNIQYGILAMVGGSIALVSGNFTIGNLVQYLTLAHNFNRPVSMVSQQINSVVMALAGAKRVFDIIDEKPEEDSGSITLVNARENEDGKLSECEERTGIWAWKRSSAEGCEYTKLCGEVTMDMVDFGYTEGKNVLNDISLFAKPGQKIAFVGSTGAGKTTITNLINRFYDIADGKIKYDGININDIRKSDLRKSLGMVLQDTNLFTGTIMDNIRYGRLDATDEEVIAAAKLANAHSFIEKLPEGYNTVISGIGNQLSQGQCQLLSIARCAVADPPAMILDEATSSVDTRTERLIQSGMDNLMKGRTVFVIAHRLSTIQNSDCIMVLENGRIIERGNHDELIALKGRYYQLYTGKTA